MPKVDKKRKGRKGEKKKKEREKRRNVMRCGVFLVEGDGKASSKVLKIRRKREEKTKRSPAWGNEPKKSKEREKKGTRLNESICKRKRNQCCKP